MSVDRIIQKVRNKDVILWVGSGFSLYAGMPRVDDIKEEILGRCDEEEQKVLNQIQNLSEFCQTFVEMRSGSKHELLASLTKLIDIEPKSFKYHQLLSEVPQIDTIITTNYDKLFELAYGKGNLVPIVQSKNFPYSENEKTKLYKIHGDIEQPDTVLITQDDYNEFFHNMNNPLWNKIKTLVAEKTILFIGFSYSDQNIDFLINSVARELGTHMKESFLLAPDMPQHRVQALAAKKIKFIQTTGQKFAEQLHSEVKKKIVVDIIEGSISAKRGSVLLKDWGIHLGFSLIDGKLSMSELKAIDDEGIKLTLSLKDFNIHEAMDSNPYDIIELDSTQIRSVQSSYKNVELPFVEAINDIVITLIPVPNVEFNADISIPFTDILLENTHCESHGMKNLDLFRFDHRFFKFEFDIKNSKINYTVKEEVKTVKQARLVFGFLNALVNTEEGIIILPHPTTKIDFPSEELRLNYKVIENENSKQQKDINYIFELLNKLVLIEEYYRVRFKEFHFNISAEEHVAIALLIANIKNQSGSLEKLNFDMIVTDYDHFKETVLNEDTLMRVKYQKEITFQLFEEEIVIKNKTLTITAKDAYLINNKDVRQQLKKRNNNTLSISFGSRSNNFTYEFIPETPGKPK